MKKLLLYVSFPTYFLITNHFLFSCIINSGILYIYIFPYVIRILFTGRQKLLLFRNTFSAFINIKLEADGALWPPYSTCW